MIVLTFVGEGTCTCDLCMCCAVVKYVVLDFRVLSRYVVQACRRIELLLVGLSILVQFMPTVQYTRKVMPIHCFIEIILHCVQCAVMRCSVLVCWLGHESLQNECIRLVRELWMQGISADLLNESLELDSIEDIQEFCRKSHIPHIAILNDKTLFYERKQVKVRTLDSGKFTEKTMTTTELAESLLQKHAVERSDPQEAAGPSSKISGSASTETQSGTLPPVNISVVPTGKLSSHMKRRFYDQVNLQSPCIHLCMHSVWVILG